jgi:TRAP-type C4-dicarboxylate transport system permease small subunit
MAAAAFLALARPCVAASTSASRCCINHLPATAQRWLDVFCHVPSPGMAGALAWYSIRLVMQSHEFNDISTGLDATPLWIPQLGMAIGTTLVHPGLR